MLQAPTDRNLVPERPHVNFSKFATGDLPTVQVPLEVINRPIPSVLDEEKVLRFMQDIQVSFVEVSTGGLFSNKR